MAYLVLGALALWLILRASGRPPLRAAPFDPAAARPAALTRQPARSVRNLFAPYGPSTARFNSAHVSRPWR